MKNLKDQYAIGEQKIYSKLYNHIESGGRIVLTTNT
jgi:hypothetical protein